MPMPMPQPWDITNDLQGLSVTEVTSAEDPTEEAAGDVEDNEEEEEEVQQCWEEGVNDIIRCPPPLPAYKPRT